ncbi:hypothetical protein QYF61_005934 [Mycteria americana]|uniref:Uncharacterized protein n=1 Tax=Mycteria americana TaxID=33587 RepID=A0AAN7PWL4_MYCAM|nr:hypothetical protein QYF61_005934 [Mycteria americana]
MEVDVGERLTSVRTSRWTTRRQEEIPRSALHLTGLQSVRESAYFLVSLPHHYTMSLSTSSKRPLNTSRDGDSTTSLGSLFRCWTTLSAAVESDEVSPQPPFLQAQQPQVPQPLPISLVLQTLPQLRCPSLDTLQPLNVSLVVRGPTLNTAFEVRPHQCRVQGHDHCPTPAGHAIPDTSQNAVGFLGHLGTLPAHIHPAVDQHPQVLLCLAASQPLFPKPVALHGVAVTQAQDLALSLVDPTVVKVYQNMKLLSNGDKKNWMKNVEGSTKEPNITNRRSCVTY